MFQREENFLEKLSCRTYFWDVEKRDKRAQNGRFLFIISERKNPTQRQMKAIISLKDFSLNFSLTFKIQYSMLSLKVNLNFNLLNCINISLKNFDSIFRENLKKIFDEIQNKLTVSLMIISRKKKDVKPEKDLQLLISNTSFSLKS